MSTDEKQAVAIVSWLKDWLAIIIAIVTLVTVVWKISSSTKGTERDILAVTADVKALKDQRDSQRDMVLSHDRALVDLRDDIREVSNKVGTVQELQMQLVRVETQLAAMNQAFERMERSVENRMVRTGGREKPEAFQSPEVAGNAPILTEDTMAYYDSGEDEVHSGQLDGPREQAAEIRPVPSMPADSGVMP